MGKFTYVRRATFVEAFQVPPDDDKTREWPAWFFKALSRGELSRNTSGVIHIPGNGDTDRSNFAEVGDWLVKLEDGTYAAYNLVDFDKLFSSVERVSERD